MKLSRRAISMKAESSMKASSSMKANSSMKAGSTDCPQGYQKEGHRSAKYPTRPRRPFKVALSPQKIQNRVLLK